MSEQWKQDMRWSASIAKQSLSIFRDMLHDRNLQIMQVEGKDEEVCQMLDALCGIDYFLLKSDKQTFGVAWRCQRVEPGKEFNSFTIRKSRDSRTKTEYEKRKQAIKQKGIYPFYVAQAFVNKNNNEIISMAITTTEDELAFLDNPLSYKEVRHTGKDQIGQSEFYVLYWVDMRLFGYNVIVYKNGVGIS